MRHPALFVAMLGLALGCADGRSGPDAPTRGSVARGLAAVAVAEAPAQPPAPFIIVTLDGVRWQEVFEGTDPSLSKAPAIPAAVLLPNLYALGQEQGAFVGAPGFGEIAASGPNFISLPGYNELLTGRVPAWCGSNDCPQTKIPTLLDEALDSGAKVAAFASWERIGRAVTARRGTFKVDCGRGLDPFVPKVLGSGESRPDELTAAEALRYFETERPDVLYLGLGDTDEYAHHHDYARYIASLRRADGVLGRLRTFMLATEQGRRTHLVVLPDHGRARDFEGHGGFAPESARVWLVAAGPGVTARGMVRSPQKRYLADVAPTLRSVLGLRRDSAEGAGVPMAELWSPAERPTTL